MLKSVIQQARKAVIRSMKKKPVLYVSDTTLRDGEQMPGGSLLAAEKVRIARQLEAVGVHSIDAGFPVAGVAEVEGVAMVAAAVKSPVVTALCRARTEDVDAARQALKDKTMRKRGVSIFIGTSPRHRENKLRMSKTEIIDRSLAIVDYAADFFPIISFAPEDASRTEIDFLVELYEKVIDAGVANIGFTDTVGCLNPESTRRYIGEIVDGTPNIDRALLAVHFHNDLGMATANTLAAVRTGCVNIFQGTLLGVGERAGNTSLEQVALAASIEIDGAYPKKPHVDLKALRKACGTVAACMGLSIPPNQPVVGANVFRTESGIHQHGLLSDPQTYELFPPETVGAARELVLGKHSGKHALAHLLKDGGIETVDGELDAIYDCLMSYFRTHKDIAPDAVLAMARDVIAQHS